MKKAVKRITPFRVKKQAINDLENGLELYEVSQKYNVSIDSIKNWRKQVAFGVPGLEARVRHSASERAKAVREIRSGFLTIAQAMIKYQVRKKKTIQNWIKENSSDLVVTIPPPILMSEKEQEELKAIQERCKALESALSNANLKIAGLETLIDVAEKELHIEIRKKSGTKQSK